MNPRLQLGYHVFKVADLAIGYGGHFGEMGDVGVEFPLQDLGARTRNSSKRTTLVLVELIEGRTVEKLMMECDKLDWLRCGIVV